VQDLARHLAAVRREHRGRRVGHAGTLDPFATGLLLVLVGRATRIQRYLMALTKSYETIARLGATSTDGRHRGRDRGHWQHPPDPLSLPTGELMQAPPAYSAVKVDGKRAYARATGGEHVVLAERPVTVYRFDQLWREGDRRRSLSTARPAPTWHAGLSGPRRRYCTELRRTAIGPFQIGDAHRSRLVSLADALSFMPSLVLDGDDALRAAHGVAVAGESGDGAGAVLARRTPTGRSP